MKSFLPPAFQQIRPSLLFLAIAILIGGYIRLSAVIRSPAPINDGGMFYAMTLDLAANDYHLPASMSYNHLGLPFAYPPLAFYLAGGLTALTGWDLFDLFRLLPAVLAVLAIPAFYLLARELCPDEGQLILATLVFTFLPTSFDWLIMGGGLTRAPAFLFSLLALFAIYRLYTRKEGRYIFWSAVLAALSLLTHPETGPHLIASALIFFLFFGRNRAGILKSGTVAALTLVLTAPWWATVLGRYGFAPFLAASRTGWYSREILVQLLRFDLTHEANLQIISVLGLIGFFWMLAERKPLLPLWLIAIFVSEPRSAPLYAAPALSLLATHVLAGLLNLFDRLRPESRHPVQPFASPISRLTLVFLLGQWIYAAYGTTLALTNLAALNHEDLTAFRWTAAHTPEDSRFLIVTGSAPFLDPAAEWFPALTGRQSLTTLQGQEWNAAVRFGAFQDTVLALQSCYHQTPACLETWLTETGLQADYLLIRTPLSATPPPLTALLAADDGYALVYRTETIAIFQIK